MFTPLLALSVLLLGSIALGVVKERILVKRHFSCGHEVALKGPLSEVRAVSLIECSNMCTHSKACVSINYNKKSGICQLLDTFANGTCALLKQSPGFVHFEKTKVCTTNKGYFNGKCYKLNNKRVGLEFARKVSNNYVWNMAAIETKADFNFLKLYYLNSGNLADSEFFTGGVQESAPSTGYKWNSTGQGVLQSELSWCPGYPRSWSNPCDVITVSLDGVACFKNDPCDKKLRYIRERDALP